MPAIMIVTRMSKAIVVPRLYSEFRPIAESN